jgi:hypothetical protein
MGSLQTDNVGGVTPTFRLDVQLHDLLTGKPVRPKAPPRTTGAETLLEPIYPQHPELSRNHTDVLARPHIPPSKRHWTAGPCFPMYSATHDWGTIESPHFDEGQLKEMKKECQPHCFSTLNRNLAFCYNDGRAARWILKQAVRGFQGVKGSFS